METILVKQSSYQELLLPRYFGWHIITWVTMEPIEHNTLLKRLYYWKGLKPSVAKHIKMCYHCQKRNKQVVKYATLHFDVATFPMAIHLYGLDR